MGKSLGLMVPGLAFACLGKRPDGDELPEGVDLVVDLTAEFPEPKEVTAGRTYRSLPTLDGTAPEKTAFAAVKNARPGASLHHSQCSLLEDFHAAR